MQCLLLGYVHSALRLIPSSLLSKLIQLALMTLPHSKQQLRMLGIHACSIHDVPHDGDCLFSAIGYQLDSIDIQNIDAHYGKFPPEPEPVACDSTCNADTKAPITRRMQGIVGLA